MKKERKKERNNAVYILYILMWQRQRKIERKKPRRNKETKKETEKERKKETERGRKKIVLQISTQTEERK